MRAILPALFLLLLTACGPATEPATTAPVVSAAPDATPPPTPTDEVVTGNPVIDSIRKEQAAIDALFKTGMLQQKNVSYACTGIRGTVEILRYQDEVRLVRNRYNEGQDRTITDRFYYQDGELIHQFSETLRWEFDGTTQFNQNGTPVPGIINYVNRYRYYFQDGGVVKAMKRKFQFTSLEVQPAEEDFPLQDMPSVSDLPYRTELARMAVEEGAVDCAVFR